MKGSTTNSELLEIFNRTPPKICRLLARTRNGLAPLTNQEIAAAAGLARSTIAQLSKRSSWDAVPLGTIMKFATGCGVNLLNAKARARVLLGQVRYIRRAKGPQRGMFNRLLPPTPGQSSTESVDQPFAQVSYATLPHTP